MGGVKGKGVAFYEKEYNQIKELLELGLSISRAASISKRSATLVSIVSRTADFTNYQEVNRARYQKPKPEQPEQPKEEPTFNVDDSVKLKALLRIADALERIADCYETPLQKEAKEFKFFGDKK